MVFFFDLGDKDNNNDDKDDDNDMIIMMVILTRQRVGESGGKVFVGY